MIEGEEMNVPMKSLLVKRSLSVVFLYILVCCAAPGMAQQDERVDALARALVENRLRLEQYRWTETTIVSVKGEEKARVQKQCYYTPDGKAIKQDTAPPAQKKPGKKQAELMDYLERAAVLFTQYVPPEADRIQASRKTQGIQVSNDGDGTIKIDAFGFVKQGDRFTINVDPSTYLVRRMSLKSYLADNPKDAISMEVSFALLESGVSYPAKMVLIAPAKNIQVVRQNSDYQQR